MRFRFVFSAALCIAASGHLAQAQTSAPATMNGTVGAGVPAFTVRGGYSVTAASDDLGQARFLEFDDKGTLFVSQPNRGKIIALRDANRDGKYEVQTTFVEGKTNAHGMHFFGGWLWFGRDSGIEKARDTNADGVADEVVAVVDGLPKGGHWWRTIFVTPTGFFTSIGDSGNITDESDTDRQKIWFYDLDGKNRKLWATGIRNTEKLRFRPGTTELYGADHGSDNFGKVYGEGNGKPQPVTDQIPPCEFNHYVEGAFYGHPFITAQGIPRPEYAERPDILDLVIKTTPPAWNFGAHWAPNGWTFTTKPYFAQGDAFVAAHGSWNSSKKVGYRIERVMFDAQTGKPYGAQMVVNTLSADGRDNLARPTDVVEAPDGTLLWSCDQTNRVYRLSRTQTAARTTRTNVTR